MHFAQDPIFIELSKYAYEPMMVYLLMFAMMIASGFGLPVPEEVTIVSVGFLAFMGANPHLFPPPYAGAPVIVGYEAAVWVSLAVFFADNLVFWIGRLSGRKLMKSKRFKPFFEGPIMEKIDRFVKKYGTYAAFIFRFTPGIRFPAHIFLGVSKFSPWKFMTVDGLAVLISVPTQILLVEHFGEEFLTWAYKFKVYLGIVLGIVLVYFLSKKFWERIRTPKNNAVKKN